MTSENTYIPKPYSCTAPVDAKCFVKTKAGAQVPKSFRSLTGPNGIGDKSVGLSSHLSAIHKMGDAELFALLQPHAAVIAQECTVQQARIAQDAATQQAIPAAPGVPFVIGGPVAVAPVAPVAVAPVAPVVNPFMVAPVAPIPAPVAVQYQQSVAPVVPVAPVAVAPVAVAPGAIKCMALTKALTACTRDGSTSVAGGLYCGTHAKKVIADTYNKQTVVVLRNELNRRGLTIGADGKKEALVNLLVAHDAQQPAIQQAQVTDTAAWKQQQADSTAGSVLKAVVQTRALLDQIEAMARGMMDAENVNVATTGVMSGSAAFAPQIQ